MTAKPDTIVIVGAALAGASAAKTLREERFDGTIRIIGAERHNPYIRPPLSKGYLAGTDDRASIDVEHPDWYRDHDVDLRLGTRIVSLDAGAAEVTTDTGETLRYDALSARPKSQLGLLHG